jgi:hypothetical protein
MNSPEKKRAELNLEEDLLITPEDFATISKRPPHEAQDLNGYLEFLEQIGAFTTKKIKKIFYEEEFKLT